MLRNNPRNVGAWQLLSEEIPNLPPLNKKLRKRKDQQFPKEVWGSGGM